MTPRIRLAIVVALLCLFLTGMPGAEAAPATADPEASRVIVAFVPEVTVSARNAILRAAGLQPTGRTLGPVLLARAASPRQAALAVKRLSDWSQVRYAEPLGPVQAAAQPSDPAFLQGDQWGLLQSGAEDAWSVVRGSRAVIVAVLDTGVDLTHPELTSQIATNSREVPNDRKDNDGNGLVDDYFGWNYVSSTADPSDDVGHGTHVAGIVGAATDNSRGVASMSWGSRVLPVKVLDSRGNGNTFNVSSGIYYAVQRGAKVINLSFGGPGRSQMLANAIQYARSRGCVIVAAAGNQLSTTSFPYTAYPAAYPGVIGVGALDSFGRVPEWSNRGSFVDVAAPGSGIVSTGWSAVRGSGYESRSGTSMASAFVAGEGALLFSEQPALRGEQVEAAILGSVTDIGTKGADALSGRGRIDVGAALRISGLKPYPSNLSPDGDGTSDTVTFRYRLNESAVVQASILGRGRIVRVLALNQEQGPGEQSLIWDGRDAAGKGLTNGAYKMILAAGDGFGKGYKEVPLWLASPPPKISLAWASPNPVPSNGDGHSDATSIIYLLDRPAHVTIEVINAQGVVRRVLHDAFRFGGKNGQLWDGRGERRALLAPGNYAFRITARNAHGRSQRLGGVSVVPESLPAPGAAPGLSDLRAGAQSGSPIIAVCYQLSQEALVTISIRSSKGEVRKLIAGFYRPSGDRCEGWTGTDGAGRALPAGTYGYTVSAQNASGSTQASGLVVVARRGG